VLDFLMKGEDIKSQRGIEIQAGVSFGGLFSTLTVFFTGLLISNYASFPSNVRVPLLFLIISTFGFIYATLIYANASGKLNLKELKDCGRAIETADILGEFMGVYTLLISIPLAIPIVTNDTFLIGSVFLADVIGLVVYHLSGFSIIQNYFPKNHWLILGIIVGLMYVMLLLIETGSQLLLLGFVSLTLVILVAITLKTVERVVKRKN